MLELLPRKVALLFSILLTIQVCTAQYSPFRGGLTIGSGLSTVIDTNYINNGYGIPFHLGMLVNRDIGENAYLELCMRISFQGNAYKYYPGNGVTEVRGLTLFFYEFNTSYNSIIYLPIKPDLYYCIGISNSMTIADPSNYSGTRFIDEHFKRYKFSLYSGFRVQKNNTRWSILYNLSPISVVKPEYGAALVAHNPDYGGRIYLTDLSLYFAYIFDY